MFYLELLRIDTPMLVEDAKTYIHLLLLNIDLRPGRAVKIGNAPM